MFVDIFIKRTQFIKYVISGIINTIITLVAYNILINFGIHYIAANIAGYFLGVINGFVLDRKWVFKSNGKIGFLFAKFISVNIISLMLSSILLFVLVNNFSLNKTAAQFISTIITGLINYTLNRFWTFC
ncbi:MAG: GtrA family protein [Clostridium sp.]|jgi:putative flippase GtrA|uniref:GtrA family protein n=1 Tax=Clostridium sp. TaxID=1506 RepID=UPI0025BF0EC1|nr:GtrA family protein [Clostridium sp.]MCH3963092.1 GtrA family protein [Clostridium sp.]MCI1716445.1 GtrA family protein [Clostridium sp.]MCI1800785.1 GtrA family protein [Clostridium sp.]MCI1814560.1 GtrA family protein [Clostridium sp.]MCI1871470.1 GtrA family protein [Clostridium sp.]